MSESWRGLGCAWARRPSDEQRVERAGHTGSVGAGAGGGVYGISGRDAGGDPDAVGRELRRTGRRLGVQRTEEVLALVDGAPWIRAPWQHGRSCDRIGLDFYHFIEHVAVAAKACFGEGSAAAKREALRRLRAYVWEPVAMMDDPACRAKGWDLGSGPTG